MQDQSTNETWLRRLFGAGSNRAWPSPAGRLLNNWLLTVLALAACWALLFCELRGEWAINPQYDYGWVVPLLGAMLLWRRWPERPSAAPGTSPMAAIIGFGLLSLLLPLALIREANPEWRLLYWVDGWLDLGLSFCLLYRVGGGKWVRYFAPPLAFMLIAIPWPMEWEQAIIQNLMRLVAALTIQVVGWLGIPAVQHGNLIEVATGVVGINEACSGIRSLQSGLMLSLFLGEIHRFPAGRRMALIGASLICVLAANVGRTTFLTWAAANRGLQQMAAWHDTAGLLVMVVVLTSLFGLAYLIKPPADPAPGQPSGVFPIPAALPRWVAIAVLVWIAISEAATEGWYRSHEQHLRFSPRWSVAWPAGEPGFRKTTVPEESLAVLRCSQSNAAAWKDDADNQWSGFFLRWNPGKNSVQLAKGHRPDICFPAAGARLVDTRGYVVVKAKGLDLPFKYQTFQAGDQLLHVFYCLWSDCISPQGQAKTEISPWRWRLDAVLRGQRNLGQQVFEVVLIGPDTSEIAIASFQRQLRSLVRLD